MAAVDFVHWARTIGNGTVICPGGCVRPYAIGGKHTLREQGVAVTVEDHHPEQILLRYEEKLECDARREDIVRAFRNVFYVHYRSSDWAKAHCSLPYCGIWVMPECLEAGVHWDRFITPSFVVGYHYNGVEIDPVWLC